MSEQMAKFRVQLDAAKAGNADAVLKVHTFLVYVLTSPPEKVFEKTEWVEFILDIGETAHAFGIRLGRKRAEDN